MHSTAERRCPYIYDSMLRLSLDMIIHTASVLKSRKSLITLPPNHDFFTKDFHDTLAHLDSMRGLCFSSHYWP